MNIKTKEKDNKKIKNKLLEGWEGNGIKGYIKVTKREARFLMAGTPAALRQNPKLSNFLEGLGNTMRKDMGVLN